MRAARLASIATLFLSFPYGAVSGPRAEPPLVALIASSRAGPFGEAIEGVESSLGSSVRLVIVDLSTTDGASQLNGKDVRLVVAVGNNALDAASRVAGAPAIGTMILRQELTSFSGRAPVGAVVLDVALGDVLGGLARVFPRKTRVGMVRRVDAADASDATLVAQAKAAGMMLTVVDCPRPDKLMQAFLELRERVDFVWCPPDGTLYNGTTVKPLILASIENQLPVAGFSANFVRAGAAAGIYPDYRELGSQTGEMARRFLAGGERAVSIESPRKTRIALNQRVARLLGLREAEKKDAGQEIVVFE